MNALAPKKFVALGAKTRVSGPRVVYDPESARYPYQVRGIAGQTPRFLTRQEAEGWMRVELAKVPQSKRPVVRKCMCCDAEFESEGFHNRMCTSCRHVGANTDTSAYRVIRPSSRG